MSFDEIVADIAERLNLTTPDALARVGRRVNRRYRRLAVSIGMDVVRRKTQSFTVTPLTQDQTLPGEKVLSIKVPNVRLPIDAVSFAEMLEIVPNTSVPTCWALKTAGASSQVIRFNSTMDAGLDLTIEIEDVGATLSGSQVPAFPESWHDILVFGAMADEQNKKEKTAAGIASMGEADRLTGELRVHIAANGYKDFQQGKKNLANSRLSFLSGSGGGGGGSSTNVGTVTHTVGALTADLPVVGNGGADIKVRALVEADITNLVADLALKAPLASPVFTGDPIVPTANISDNDTSAANTAYVMRARESPAALSDVAAPALDASQGTLFTLVATGNRTIAVPTNPRTGQRILIAHTASGGGRTLALNTGAGGFRFGTTIAALSATTVNLTDYIECVYNAVASKWDVIGYTKGF